MYTAHFGLTEPPFAITPDPRYLYMSPRHREAMAHLRYGVTEPGGFVVLTGEVGTGKTTLCRSLLERLEHPVDVALILNPCLTSTELLAAICDEFNVPYTPGTASLKSLLETGEPLAPQHRDAHPDLLVLLGHAARARPAIIAPGPVGA